jgi:hypothetical protein
MSVRIDEELATAKPNTSKTDLMTAITIKRAADVHSYTADAFYGIGDLRDWIASAKPKDGERRRNINKSTFGAPSLFPCQKILPSRTWKEERS